MAKAKAKKIPDIVTRRVGINCECGSKKGYEFLRRVKQQRVDQGVAKELVIKKGDTICIACGHRFTGGY